MCKREGEKREGEREERRRRKEREEEVPAPFCWLSRLRGGSLTANPFSLHDPNRT